MGIGFCICDAVTSEPNVSVVEEIAEIARQKSGRGTASLEVALAWMPAQIALE